jgi:uracil-DNA glycosylase
VSLDLDKRRRAMLREMGVRLWQPTPVAQPEASAALAAQPDAINLIAAPARSTPAGTTNDLNVAAKTMPVTPAARAPAPVPAPALRQNTSTPPERAPTAGPAAPGWQIGAAQVLYAHTPSPAASAAGARWLVLGETPAASLRKPVFDPFEGDAGKLLGNMLRAAGLHKSGQAGEAGEVLLAPLARLAAGGVSASDLPGELATLVAQTRPDVILVMGRLAAQAVLQSSEPLGKLRGRVHQVHGTKTVVTYDAAVLLRSPLEKAKAWEDLCLALTIAHTSS